MNNGWKRGRLIDVIELKRGYDLPQKQRAPGKVPIVSSSGFSDTHSAAKVKGPGVVTGRYGTIGTVYFVEEDFWPLNTTLYVRDFKGNDPRFIAYFLRGIDFQAYSDKAAVPGVNRNHLHEASVSYPAPPEQRAIASILGALDDKIDLNRRMNETLESMARALFKDWFVDFGPTRAKMEGREPYLAPELSSLFPDRLDDEGKPEGWTSEPIGEHVWAQKGLSYKGSGLTDENLGIPLHNLNSVLEGGGYKASGLKYYSGEYQSRHRIQRGDLIVANTEQGFDHLLIGYSAIVPRWAGAEGLFSHHLFKIEPREGSSLSRVWLHYVISSSPTGDVIRRFSNGTTVNMLPSDSFVTPSFVVPPRATVSSFDGAATLLLDRKELNFEESRTLAQTRDLLLPKLMSGEIQVRDAERMVEEVV